MKTAHLETIVELAPVIVSVVEDSPRILVGNGKLGGAYSLLATSPSLERERSLEKALREWVREKSGISLGYIEQLYTFGNKGRFPERESRGEHIITISYLGLTKNAPPALDASWVPVYDFLPWEDLRRGDPPILRQKIVPALKEWVQRTENDATRLERKSRANISFGMGSSAWDAERALDRYEILYEAKILHEAKFLSAGPETGTQMAADHRRIVASALSRLRGKLRYRPVVFELLPSNFTLFEIQRVVEALRGQKLHKQNFRRLIESEGLVEPLGSRAKTKGRPANLFRFRKEVLLERPSLGIRVGTRG